MEGGALHYSKSQKDSSNSAWIRVFKGQMSFTTGIATIVA